MVDKSIRDRTIDEVLEDVQGLAAVASQGQIKSLLAVLARCTIEVADSLGSNSAEIRNASEEVRLTASEVHAFNSSTTELTKQIIRLNQRLTWATFAIAMGTAVGAGAALVALF